LQVVKDLQPQMILVAAVVAVELQVQILFQIQMVELVVLVLQLLLQEHLQPMLVEVAGDHKMHLLEQGVLEVEVEALLHLELIML
jgi:hypothetical protein